MDNLTSILKDSDVNNATIVMDNAPVHRAAVGEVTKGHIQVRFLPAYSSFLNPIENAFSVFKLKVRELLREDNIINTINNVPNHLSNAEHRIRVLLQVSHSVIEDQETISAVVRKWPTCVLM